jgi:hypothetical protein
MLIAYSSGLLLKSEEGSQHTGVDNPFRQIYLSLMGTSRLNLPAAQGCHMTAVMCHCNGNTNTVIPTLTLVVRSAVLVLAHRFISSPDVPCGLQMQVEKMKPCIHHGETG